MKLRYDLFWKMFLFLIFSLCYISCQAETTAIEDEPFMSENAAFVEPYSFAIIMPETTTIITVEADGKPILEIFPNGDVRVKGRLRFNDRQLADALWIWARGCCLDEN